MAAPLITAITTVPNRENATNQASYSNDVDTFFSEVDGFQTQANAQAQYLDSVAAEVDASEAAAAASALEASGYASTAIDARDAAISSSVYKGTWEGKTSAGVIGESYSYQGSYIYRLNVNLANVSTSIPSPTNTDWQLINVVPFEAPCKPTFDLDFANQDFTIYDKQDGFVKRPLSDIVTQARSTAGSSVNAIGGVTEFAAGESRFTFDGESGEALGYLSEESRTRLNTFYIAPTVNENIATTALNYTISMWGAGTITLSGSYSGTLVGVDEFTRVDLTFTATAGTLTLAYSGSCLNVQLEAGSFATSLILGDEGTAITRAADSMTRELRQEFNPREGTFIFYTRYNSPASTAGGIFGLSNAAGDRQIIALLDPNNNTGSPNFDNIGLFVTDSIETKSKITDVKGSGTGFHCIAVSYTNTETNIVVDGVSYGGITHAFVDGLAELRVAHLGTSDNKFFRYYPRAFDTLTLQRLTRIQ